MSQENRYRILIIEDEEPILRGLLDLFVFHGYDVDSATDGRIGLGKALSEDFDLIVLDVMLPSLDGWAICNEIRAKTRSQPIIMLTAKSSDEDIITGLTLGADDYIAKPFSVRELVLRVEAVLRRTKGALDREILLGASLRIDTLNLEGKHQGNGEKIAFTRKEIDILQYLLNHQSRPVPRGELLSEVWGYARAAHIETRTVDIHIAKLRRKIESDPKNPTLLVTIRGEGYRLFPNGAEK